MPIGPNLGRVDDIDYGARAGRPAPARGRTSAYAALCLISVAASYGSLTLARQILDQALGGPDIVGAFGSTAAERASPLIAAPSSLADERFSAPAEPPRTQELTPNRRLEPPPVYDAENATLIARSITPAPRVPGSEAIRLVERADRLPRGAERLRD